MTSRTTTETVTLFCRPGCRKCERIHEWLNDLGLDVEHIDPSTDEEARTYLLDHGFRGMPVVRTSDGQLAWGAEPQQLADALPDPGRRRMEALHDRPSLISRLVLSRGVERAECWHRPGSSSVRVHSSARSRAS